MTISVSIGGTGEGDPSYSACLPFTLSPGRTLKLEEGQGRFELLGRECEVRQERDQYTLTISGFDSVDAASTFLSRACAGLIWLGLKGSVGFKFNADTTPVELFAHPRTIADGSLIAPITSKKGWKEIDGQYDADKTVIIPKHKRLLVWAAHSVTVRVDMPLSVLSEGMLEGMSTGRPEFVLSDPKLRLACEVYMSSHFENTPAVSFLARITTLEILVQDVPASAPLQNMVERFILDARRNAEEYEQQDEIKREFESLLSRLANLRIRSIKSRIRQLVEEKLRFDPDIAAPSDVSKEVSALYDLRSNLVHTGEADPRSIGEGNNRLNDVVPRLLRVLFRETAHRS